MFSEDFLKLFAATFGGAILGVVGTILAGRWAGQHKDRKKGEPQEA